MASEHAGPVYYDFDLMFSRRRPKEPLIIPIQKTDRIHKNSTSKAAAVLVRTDDTPIAIASSGWTARSIYEYQLDDADGLLGCEAMCRIIGHKLAPASKPSHDHGRAGSSHACHAEKQLLAYVLFKHTLLTEAQAGGDEAECLLWLKHLSPLHWHGKVTIYTDTEPCEDCSRCIEAFRQVTRIKITVYFPGRGFHHTPN